jgi:oligopeptide/dipeptide ABC transporter ATP-binding protein
VTGEGGRPPLLEVDGLKVWFPVRSGPLRRRAGWVRAVDGVDLTLGRGETMALVGESGSGKTTVGRSIVRVQPPSEGTIRLDGADLTSLRGTALRRSRRRFQMVFQDPYSSLDPRQTVEDILAEPLRIHGLAGRNDRPGRIAELLTMVGLDPAFAERYPHEFSGGQRQRIGIARALAVEPDLIVCDEPVSALDVSIQAQVVNLLQRLQNDLGVAYLFIAHDLALVRHLASRVAAMYLGRIVEVGNVDDVYGQPLHPYTAALLSAVPVPDAEVERRRARIILSGEMPSPADPPPGCPFHTRCWLREQLGRPEQCVTSVPPLAEPALAAGRGHKVACHFPGESAERFGQSIASSRSDPPSAPTVHGSAPEVIR